MDDKEKILKDISEDRKKLFRINEEIEGLDKKVSFWKIFLFPLAISFIILLLVGQMGLSDGQKIGIFIITFALALILLTRRSRKIISQEKEILIEKRKNIQHEIFEKTKLLKEED
ncbi:MAG: hypothetical protein MRZ08_01635 [Anaerococcus sp.]|uniref:hypothetical protein n=1 Tax=Anaerococcus sp. TaxID=1872515 RepID=UPI00261E8D04|nr:hypothetical protein [Anaerococcus sp.]MCI5971715.1 hypothetical protein [Anaerococcus sp.]MDD6919410.1 hypothetical protein [Peptoniphilaceae bacterium]MDY2927864.1 hypothetical protein [Anaerococcus sp.]